MKLCRPIVFSKFHKTCKFEDHVKRNDFIMMSLPKTKNADVRETSQIRCHSKGLDESYPKTQVLSNVSNFVKSYGHSSEILAFYHKHSPNMVKSRDSWC